MLFHFLALPVKESVSVLRPLWAAKDESAPGIRGAYTLQLPAREKAKAKKRYPKLLKPTFLGEKRTLEIREKTTLSFIRNVFGSPVRDTRRWDGLTAFPIISCTYIIRNNNKSAQKRSALRISENRKEN